MLSGTPGSVRDIEGSFALVAREGKRVRLARSLDRPVRYFLAKREEGASAEEVTRNLTEAGFDPGPIAHLL